MPNSGIEFILAKIPKEIHDLSHNPLPEQFSLQEPTSWRRKIEDSTKCCICCHKFSFGSIEQSKIKIMRKFSGLYGISDFSKHAHQSSISAIS